MRYVLIFVRRGKQPGKMLLLLHEQIDFVVQMVQLFIVMLVGIEPNYSLDRKKNNSCRNNQDIVRSNMPDPAIDFIYHV
jgi:hypothetical protein